MTEIPHIAYGAVDDPFVGRRPWPYCGGFFVLLLVSLIGFWLILRAIKRENQFLNGLLNVPSWLLIITGMILQGPLVGYIYLGIRAGFY
jgi:hypothetical protein